MKSSASKPNFTITFDHFGANRGQKEHGKEYSKSLLKGVRFLCITVDALVVIPDEDELPDDPPALAAAAAADPEAAGSSAGGTAGAAGASVKVVGM